VKHTALENFIRKFYCEKEFPALAAQIRNWQTTPALTGKKILDATPVFRNTMVKYCALLAAGADLTVSVGQDIPCDPEIVKLLPDFGIPVADADTFNETFDAVADCAGRHKDISSRCGYAELTRSGLEYYRNCSQPVFSVDSGVLKRFETALGTGESFVRAMRELGLDISGKKLLVFGGGKVGSGTAYCAMRAGAEVTVADIARPVLPDGVNFINANDTALVSSYIAASWCVVSATGLPGVLAPYVPALLSSQALIANMGVEDEFSPALPPERVLNRKQPLNFMLDEPTSLCYIDPSMALSNAALVQLISGHMPPGISLPPEPLENAILNDIRAAGLLNNDIDFVLNQKER